MTCQLIGLASVGVTTHKTSNENIWTVTSESNILSNTSHKLYRLNYITYSKGTEY